jgi:hypothetical protein
MLPIIGVPKNRGETDVIADFQLAHLNKKRASEN